MSADTNTPTEESKVILVYRSFISQWNKRNAPAMAGLFIENGLYIGFDGSQLNSRKEIYDVFDDVFTHFPTAAYVSIVKTVVLLTPDSAMLTAVVGMTPEGQTDIAPAANAIQCMLATKENGEWRIASLQNTPAAFHGRPELSEQLSADLRHALHIGN